jgi:hypothetical protein
MLTHFYAFLFFQDWRHDLWMKRFIRDHVRYIDEIQCAAARIIQALPTVFDTMHIRRGDFQFKRTRISAEQILNNTQHLFPLQPNTNTTTIYIATDERDKRFFDPFRQKGLYTVYTMDDFKHLLKGVNTNYYGMIDQLVASKGRIFIGCWHSTFTGYIQRLRGYHSTKQKWIGHEQGILNNSFYYVPMEKQYAMTKFAPVHGATFNREFPTSWRNLNQGIY